MAGPGCPVWAFGNFVPSGSDGAISAWLATSPVLGLIAKRRTPTSAGWLFPSTVVRYANGEPAAGHVTCGRQCRALSRTFLKYGTVTFAPPAAGCTTTFMMYAFLLSRWTPTRNDSDCGPSDPR